MGGTADLAGVDEEVFYVAEFSDGEDLVMRGMGETAYPGNRKILSKQQAHPVAKSKSMRNEKTADTGSRPPFTLPHQADPSDA